MRIEHHAGWPRPAADRRLNCRGVELRQTWSEDTSIFNRDALLRVRRCTFIEREQAHKKLGIKDKGLQQFSDVQRRSRRSATQRHTRGSAFQKFNAGRAGAQPRHTHGARSRDSTPVAQERIPTTPHARKPIAHSATSASAHLVLPSPSYAQIC